MHDTLSKTESVFRQMMRKKSGSERLLMGCSMFDTSKSIVMASILAKEPDIQEQDLRVRLFLRFYKQDYEKEERERIVKHLKNLPQLSELSKNSSHR